LQRDTVSQDFNGTTSGVDGDNRSGVQRVTFNPDTQASADKESHTSNTRTSEKVNFDIFYGSNNSNKNPSIDAGPKSTTTSEKFVNYLFYFLG
jgi:hypothetical protein